MIFSNVFVANATVNYDNEVAPLYVNISSHLEKIEISGIKAECKAKLYANKSDPFKNQNGVAERKVERLRNC